MNMFKIAMASTAALGLVLAGTASAEPIRASGAMPGVFSVKKIKLARTAAPAGRESKAAYQIGTAEALTFMLSAAAAGTALYFITRGGKNFVSDSPG